MHYRNGREAKNGDQCVKLSGGGRYGPVGIEAVGILFGAIAGDDYCNGSIASTIGGPVAGACLCDMLHAEDISALLTEKGLDKRSPGK